jgi:hypothetical protein
MIVEHPGRVGNRVEGLEQGEAHQRTSTTAAGGEVSTCGHLRGLMGCRGVRG